MHHSIKLGNYKLFISLNHSTRVRGVNSILPDGRHFLLWDFDEQSLNTITQGLTLIQEKYELSTIYIVNSGTVRRYHAYCFTAQSWPDTLHILADTPLICQTYFKIGILRGYFTLRITPKGNERFIQVGTIYGRYPATCNPAEFNSFVDYDTKGR